MTIYRLDVLLSYLKPVCCSMSGSNCCFLTCIQFSQEAGQVVWYSHLFQNFPQFIMMSWLGNSIKFSVFVAVWVLFIFFLWRFSHFCQDDEKHTPWGMGTKGIAYAGFLEDSRISNTLFREMYYAPGSW